MERAKQEQYRLRRMETIKDGDSHFIRGDFYAKPTSEDRYVITQAWTYYVGDDPSVPEFIKFLRGMADAIEAWWDKA